MRQALSSRSPSPSTLGGFVSWALGQAYAPPLPGCLHLPWCLERPWSSAGECEAGSSAAAGRGAGAGSLHPLSPAQQVAGRAR